MSLLNSINSLINVVLIAMAVLMLTISGVLFYLLKIKKIKTKIKDINYNDFERRDALEYVKFEDIVSEDGEGYDAEQLRGAGMVVVGNNTFISGISIVGYNFYDSSIEEQQLTMANMIGFANLIESPIQIRQTTKAVDLSYNASIFENVTKEKKRKMYELLEEYEAMKKYAEDCVDDLDEFNSAIERLEKLRLLIRGENFLLGVSKGVNQYIDKVSGAGMNMQRIHTLMFSFTYDPSEYSTEMTKEEIYLTALRELEIKELSYSQALSAAGCTCYRLTAQELTEAFRKHYHPVTAEETTLSDILNSSYTSLYVSSSSLADMERERRGEEKFRKDMEEYQRYLQETINKTTMKTTRIVNREFEKANEQIDQEELC